jgi:hypothetical protein
MTTPSQADLSELEKGLHEAGCMAHIAASLLERLPLDKESHQTITGKPDTYYLPAEDADAMLFAVYAVHNQIKALRDLHERIASGDAVTAA